MWKGRAQTHQLKRGGGVRRKRKTTVTVQSINLNKLAGNRKLSATAA
jgi:hypothetical protein